MSTGTVHVVGAGLSGLAAAVRLAQTGRSVALHEATANAGGRCRSYYDHGFGGMIDNGNHLLLSGNHAALAYLRLIGGEAALRIGERADFPFVDLDSGQRWRVRPSEGRIPWWIFAADRRVPGTAPLDYLGIARLMFARADVPVGEVIACRGTLYKRLWRPFLLAALNTEPAAAASGLAGAVVRETLALGGKACRPLIAREGLSAALVDPALQFITRRGGTVRMEHNLRAVAFDGDRATALDFGTERVTLGTGDSVVLAVPPYIARGLVPDLTVPTAFHAIVNAHFRVEPPAGAPPMVGVVNGLTEWVFAYPGRLSVTISVGDRLLDTPRERLAQDIWNEVAAVTGVAQPLPPWQIVRERRATFAATPAQEAVRPEPNTKWRNLVLAGDWTATGLPATIEGSIRSGNRAAELVRNA